MNRPAAPSRFAVSPSPGRTENLPTGPSLGRFMRGKSRGAGRGSIARSSPMFVSRSGTLGPPEPSSPKVTCIGQVRIQSKKKNKSKQKLTGFKKMWCRCLDRPLLSKIFSWRRPNWTLSRWFKRKSRFESAETVGVASMTDLEDEGSSDETEEEDEEVETRVFMASPAMISTPPKNALLLMRCRSAPHNRSSLLARTALEAKSNIGDENVREKGGDDRRSRNYLREDAVVGPVVLTRCKSEPARTAAAKLEVLENTISVWNNTRPRDLGMPQLLPR